MTLMLGIDIGTTATKATIAGRKLPEFARIEDTAVDANGPAATHFDCTRSMLANPLVSSFDVAAALVSDIESGSLG